MSAVASTQAEVFDEHRRYLFAIAYRILGIAEDAEDVLQDAWIRFSTVDLATVDSPRSYLVTIVTRLAIDSLRLARRKREEYVGVWLPEPVPSEQALPDDLVEQAESVSFAFLLLLERLNPVERAVLVLHDVFDYPHADVAEMIGKTSTATRQALRRGRLKLGDATRPQKPVSQHGMALLNLFIHAVRTGDVDELASTLASDVVLMSDGGGVVRAASRPLAGAGPVAHFLVAMSRLEPHHEITTRTLELNGQPAIITIRHGIIENAFVFDATDQGVTAIYVVRNPEKLRRLTSAA